jgi:hypothetical protein
MIEELASAHELHDEVDEVGLVTAWAGGLQPIILSGDVILLIFVQLFGSQHSSHLLK